MPIFRRLPVSGADTPSSEMMNLPYVPLSRANQLTLRRCRDVLEKHLDVDVLHQLHDFLPTDDQHIPDMTSSNVAAMLDRMEQTGNDVLFDRFVSMVRRRQRHLAAVVEYTRNEIRTNRKQYGDQDSEQDECRDVAPLVCILYEIYETLFFRLYPGPFICVRRS